MLKGSKDAVIGWETSRQGGVEALDRVVCEALLPQHCLMLVPRLQAELQFPTRSQTSGRQLKKKAKIMFTSHETVPFLTKL